MQTQLAADGYETAYRKAIEMLKPFDGICPRDCNLCEEREILRLLPREAAWISGSAIPKSLLTSLVRTAGSMDQQCPAQCVLTKDCKIYGNRPLDCRSFPVVPSFKPDRSVTTRVSASYCPIADLLPEGFPGAVQAAWQLLAPYLSQRWKKEYNETPCAE